VNKELEAFSYSVSHDLRAPLRAIDGFSQALLEDYHDRLENEGRDYLKRVRAGAQHMASLVDDLLKLSRVTRSELQYSDVDLSTLAQQITAELHEREPQRPVDVCIVPDQHVQGDSRLLRIALENLFNNAWKFTHGRDHARIEFAPTPFNGGVAYFVRDNGVGFDMAYVDKLFGAFQRLHNAREFAGTGIGLATARRVIHKHGGTIWAEGEIGEGATFYFRL
jgi:light-regulated signal transduction histidine kinase (bacteriophytochrome)